MLPHRFCGIFWTWKINVKMIVTLGWWNPKYSCQCVLLHLKIGRNLERGIHPTVAVQHSSIHPTATLWYKLTQIFWFQKSTSSLIVSHHITVDWFSEELFGAGEEAAGEEDGGGRLVEQLERPVVDRDLVHLVFIQSSNAHAWLCQPQRRTWWL